MIFFITSTGRKCLEVSARYALGPRMINKLQIVCYVSYVERLTYEKPTKRKSWTVFDVPWSLIYLHILSLVVESTKLTECLRQHVAQEEKGSKMIQIMPTPVINSFTNHKVS